MGISMPIVWLTVNSHLVELLSECDGLLVIWGFEHTILTLPDLVLTSTETGVLTPIFFLTTVRQSSLSRSRHSSLVWLKEKLSELFITYLPRFGDLVCLIHHLPPFWRNNEIALFQYIGLGYKW